MRSAVLVKYLFVATLVITLGTAHFVSDYQSQRTDERLHDQREQFERKLDGLESRLREDMKRFEQQRRMDSEATRDVMQAMEGMFDEARGKQ